MLLIRQLEIDLGAKLWFEYKSKQKIPKCRMFGVNIIIYFDILYGNCLYILYYDRYIDINEVSKLMNGIIDPCLFSILNHKT